MEVGKQFSSFDELKNFISTYERDNFVQLHISDSHKLCSAKNASSKIQNAKKELVYFKMQYSCIHGGKKFSSKSTNQRQTRFPSSRKNMAKTKTYDKTTIENALHAIRNGMGYRKASLQFKVPKTTLIDKNKKKYKNENAGAPTILRPEEENILVQWIFRLGKAGFPVSKPQLIESVTELLKKLKRPNPFKDGIPGRHWYEGFMNRHKDISCRVAQNLTKSRADVTEVAIREWFKRVERYVEEESIQEVLEDPTRVFNCDETAFFLAPKENKVLVPKNMKKVYSKIANDEKDNLTVLLTLRADGAIASPLPLDVGLFKSLKDSWKQCVRTWRIKNDTRRLGREDFAPLLKTCLDCLQTESMAQNAFRKCGLFPFNPNAVEYGNLVANTTCTPTTERNERTAVECVCDRNIQFLKEFEGRLNSNILQKFKEEDVPESHSALYTFWKNIKNCPLTHPSSVDENNTNSFPDQENLTGTSPVNENNTNSFQDQENLTGTSPVNENNTNSFQDQENLTISSDIDIDFLFGNKDLLVLDISENGEAQILNQDTPSPILSTVQNEPVLNSNRTSTPENIPSPFKNALFWPKCDDSLPKKKKTKKRTPTVAISDDFIEYQRRLDSEKKRKIEEQLKKKEMRLMKKATQKNLEQGEDSEDSETIDDENLMPKTINDESINLNLERGDFVIVTYEEELFPGCVLGEKVGEGYSIKTMSMCEGGAYWKWPEKDDVLTYCYADIKGKISSPELKNSRGQYFVPEISAYRNNK
ncbi:hypothetical protein M8J76_016235 [Diaphorina citri]|nr:hypothetical protein M8J76_016235 [Diaphorina citri]